MIDMHLHHTARLLPGVDDGASSLEISRAMLDKARQFGFDRLVATPHLSGPLDPGYNAQVQRALSQVRSAARGAEIAVDLGFEILLSADLPSRLEHGEPVTLAGSDAVLVEAPFAGWPLHVDSTLFNIQSAGFRPLLAHPERYAAVQQDPDKALALASRGVLLQLTIGSIVGLFGKSAQRVAELLLRENAVAILASDAHSAGQRFVSVEDGLRRAGSLVGAARASQLVTANPAALLGGKPLPAPFAVDADESSDGWRKSLFRSRTKVRT